MAKALDEGLSLSMRVGMRHSSTKLFGKLSDLSFYKHYGLSFPEILAHDFV